MNRTWFVAVALAASCAGRCGSRAEDSPAITKEPSAASASSKLAMADVGAPPVAPAFPREWAGTYVIASLASDDPATPKPIDVRRYDVAADGTTAAPLTLAAHEIGVVAGLTFSVDGRSIAYGVSTRSATASSSKIVVIDVDGTNRREVAKCDWTCDVAGFDADGEVWFVDRSTTSELGEVKHVPSHGGGVVRWPNSFADCLVRGVVSADGRDLLLMVDNQLGWPACVEGNYQGFYVVPLGNPAVRDKTPTANACFTKKKASEINLQIDSAVFDGVDRILFSASDAWDSTPVAPLRSCKRDGSDLRDEKPRPQLATDTIEGKPYLTLHTPGDGDAGDAVTKILGPVPDGIGAFAHRAP